MAVRTFLKRMSRIMACGSGRAYPSRVRRMKWSGAVCGEVLETRIALTELSIEHNAVLVVPPGGSGVITNNHLSVAGAPADQTVFTLVSPLPSQGRLILNDAMVGWIKNPANNHYYAATVPGDRGAAAAEAASYGGYLTTISNAAENLWMTQNFARAGQGWIGLHDPGGWDNGESSSYRNWYPGEPNSWEEDAVHIYFTSQNGSGAQWNDIRPNERQHPGIVEKNNSDGIVLSFTQDDVNHGRVTYRHFDARYTSQPEAPDDFTFIVSDGAGHIIGETVFRIVTGNVLPTVSDIADQRTFEYTPTGEIPFTVGSTIQTVTGSSSNTDVVPNANIVFAGSGANRTVTITPAAGAKGSATITITVGDGTGTATATFELTVSEFPLTLLVELIQSPPYKKGIESSFANTRVRALVNDVFHSQGLSMPLQALVDLTVKRVLADSRKLTMFEAEAALSSFAQSLAGSDFEEALGRMLISASPLPGISQTVVRSGNANVEFVNLLGRRLLEDFVSRSVDTGSVDGGLLPTNPNDFTVRQLFQGLLQPVLERWHCFYPGVYGDMAAFSWAAYRPDPPNPAKFKHVADFEEASRLYEQARDAYAGLLGQGWQIMGSTDLPGITLNAGWYENENAAVKFWKRQVGDHLEITMAIRGTDDLVTDVPDWVNLNAHYSKLSSAFDALRSYLADHKGVCVFVTGHSLGGAIAQMFMARRTEPGDLHYRAVTFGSPGAGKADSAADARVVQFANTHDLVPAVGLNARPWPELLSDMLISPSALIVEIRRLLVQPANVSIGPGFYNYAGRKVFIESPPQLINNADEHEMTRYLDRVLHLSEKDRSIFLKDSIDLEATSNVTFDPTYQPPDSGGNGNPPAQPGTITVDRVNPVGVPRRVTVDVARMVTELIVTAYRRAQSKGPDNPEPSPQEQVLVEKLSAVIRIQLTSPELVTSEILDPISVGFEDLRRSIPGGQSNQPPQPINADVVARFASSLTESVISHWVTPSIREEIADFLDFIPSEAVSGFLTSELTRVSENLLYNFAEKIVPAFAPGLTQTFATVGSTLVNAVSQTAGYQALSNFFQGINPVLITVNLATSFVFGNDAPDSDTEAFFRSLVLTGEPVSTIVFSTWGFVEYKINKKALDKARRLAGSTERDKTITRYLRAAINEFFASDARTLGLAWQADADLNNPDHEHRGDRQYALALEAAEVFKTQLLESLVAVPPSSVVPLSQDQEDGVEIGKRQMWAVITSGASKALEQLVGTSGFELFELWKGSPFNSDTDGAAVIDFMGALLNARLSVAPGPLSSPGTNLIRLPETTHSHDGAATNPDDAYDGSFDTPAFASVSGGNGGVAVYFESRHTFSNIARIDSIAVAAKARSYAVGSYIRNHNGFIIVEYSLNGGQDWSAIPGASRGYSGGDGDTEVQLAGVFTGLNLRGVTDIRVTLTAHGNASGSEGSSGANIELREISVFGEVFLPAGQTSPGTFSSALGAIVTMDGNGNYSYDPGNSASFKALGAGETASDSFNYDVTNGMGRMNSVHVTINLTGINDPPIDIGISSISIPENQPSGTTVGIFSATDPDASDTFTYELVSGTGSADNASFTISGNTLKTAASFNFEARSSYAIHAKVTDAGGLSFEKSFTISVTDVIEAPIVTGPGAVTTNPRPTITWTKQFGSDATTISDVWLNKQQGASVINMLVANNLPGTSYTLTQDLALGTYIVWVRTKSTVDPGVVSGWSIRRTFRVATAPTLIGPSGRAGDSTPTLDWQGVNGGQTYRVYVSSLSKNLVVYDVPGLNTLNFTIPADLPIGRYRYWVQARSAFGDLSNWSLPKDFQVVTAPVLSGPSASTFDMTPSFSWTNMSFPLNGMLAGATSYDFRLDQVLSASVVQNYHVATGLTTTNYTISTDLPLGIYRAYVRARNSDTQGDFTTAMEFFAGGRPVVNVIGSTSNTTPTITWKTVDGAASYEIFISLSATPNTSLIRQAGIHSTSFTVPQPLAKGQYRVWVRAVNAADNSFSYWSDGASTNLTITDASDVQNGGRYSSYTLTAIPAPVPEMTSESTISMLPAVVVGAESALLSSTLLSVAEVAGVLPQFVSAATPVDMATSVILEEADPQTDEVLSHWCEQAWWDEKARVASDVVSEKKRSVNTLPGFLGALLALAPRSLRLRRRDGSSN